MATPAATLAIRSDEASALAKTPVAIRPRTASVGSVLCILLVSTGIYAAPWIAPPTRDGSALPAVFSADFYAYLNLSHVFTFHSMPHHDPWYGVPIQPKFGHSSFRGAFVAFGALRWFAGSDVVASIVWNIWWSALIACSLWLLLRELFPRRSAVFLFAGTSMVVFFSLSTLKINFVDWLHLLSGAVPDNLPLPFIRMFFPQIAVPLLAFYFLSCKKAWDRGMIRDYVVLALLQTAAFVSFPYASVFMGLATLIFLALIAKRSDFRKRIVPFGILGVTSLLVDALYLWLVLVHAGPARPAQARTPLFHLDLSQLRIDFGGTVVLLLVMSTLLLLVARKGSARLLPASIGLANVAMLLADCVVDPRFLVSHHAGYFVQLSLGLEFCALACWGADFCSQRFFKVTAAAASLFFVANGALAARAAVRANAETNTRLASFAAVISRLNLSPDDLVIAPANNVDDVSTTVPLLSRAYVLYTPEAEILLGPAGENVITERHVVYLFLSGRDSTWTDAQLSIHQVPSALLTLGQRIALQYFRRSDLAEKEVRESLVPQLLALDKGSLPPVLSGARRIVIVDEIDHPAFDDFHVNKLLTVAQDYKVGPIRVRFCSAPARN